MTAEQSWLFILGRNVEMSRVRLPKDVEIWRKQLLPIPLVITFVLLCAPVPAQHQSEAQKKVLVLYSLREGSPLADMSEKVMLRGKMEGLAASIDYYREYIDVARFPDPEYQSALRDFLKRKYESQRFDLIITVAASAIDFIDQYGEELFPGTPVVFISGGNTPIEVLRFKVTRQDETLCQ